MAPPSFVDAQSDIKARAASPTRVAEKNAKDEEEFLRMQAEVAAEFDEISQMGKQQQNQHQKQKQKQKEKQKEKLRSRWKREQVQRKAMEKEMEIMRMKLAAAGVVHVAETR